MLEKVVAGGRDFRRTRWVSQLRSALAKRLESRAFNGGDSSSSPEA